MEPDFVGRRLAFPVDTDATRNVAFTEGLAAVEQSIQLILRTAPGERPMRPDFGSRLQDLLYAPLDVSLPGRVEAEVRAALARWEPRIDVLEVTVAVDPERASTVFVLLTYRLRQSNDPRNLVFPFYVIGTEAPP